MKGKGDKIVYHIYKKSKNLKNIVKGMMNTNKKKIMNLDKLKKDNKSEEEIPNTDGESNNSRGK